MSACGFGIQSGVKDEKMKLKNEMKEKKKTKKTAHKHKNEIKEKYKNSTAKEQQ